MFTRLPVTSWFFCILGLTLGSRAYAGTLTLEWDPDPEPSVTGYVLSYGTQSGVYTTSIDVGAVTIKALSDLADDTTYYFVVQAYDSLGDVSDPSAEIVGQTPAGINPPPPPSLSIVCPFPSGSSGDGNPVAVSFNDPTVTGGVSPTSAVCSPASGTLFPVGNTPLTCTATDSSQQTASCNSVVAVTSSPPPSTGDLTIVCPTIAPVTISNGSTAQVIFADPTVTGGTAPVTTQCFPGSGDVFGVGQRTVACIAVDALQQVAYCTTVAIVTAAPE
jgi:hypothetical protein